MYHFLTQGKSYESHEAKKARALAWVLPGTAASEPDFEFFVHCVVLPSSHPEQILRITQRLNVCKQGNKARLLARPLPGTAASGPDLQGECPDHIQTYCYASAAHCITHIAHCTLHTAHYTLHTAQSYPDILVRHCTEHCTLRCSALQCHFAGRECV